MCANVNRAMPLAHRSRWFTCCVVSSAAIYLAAAAAPRRAGQGQPAERVNEIVANLASGQVTIIAAHDGVLIATVGRQFEPENLPPLLIPMTASEAIVVLGAVDWVQPPRFQSLFRLDAALPGLARTANGGGPRLSAETGLSSPEQVGLSLLEPLRAVASNLHGQLELPEDLPLDELVFVHQPTDESSPDIWDLSFPLKQTFLQENFWDTQVERPRPIQLYPDSENKSGLVDIRYPADDRSPGLVDWLYRPAGRLLQGIQSDPKVAKSLQDLQDGQSRKTHLADLVPLIKQTLESLAPPASAPGLAVLDGRKGFAWVIRPPQPAQIPQPSRPPGAPSLKSNPHA